MRDGNHNLKLSVETLSGFNYKHETQKNGSQLVVKDEDGNIMHEGEFKSFSANFMRLLFGGMVDGTATVKAKDLANSDVTIEDMPVSKMNMAGGSTVQKFGLCVGSGSGAVANSDYALSFVSDLTYGATIIGTPAVDGSTIKLDITREISNTSGGTIALEESGLVCGSEGEYNSNVLIARDLVSVSLLNNKKSTWTYSIVVDFDGTAGGFVKDFLDNFIINWEEITATSGIVAVYLHSAVVYDSKMWVIGGLSGSGSVNNVWSSSDGITWWQAAVTAPFTVRYGHTSVVFDSKMWVIGGNAGASGYADYNDVWSSTDGATWTEELANDPTPPATQFDIRNSHTAMVFDDGSGEKMWVIGGVGTATGLYIFNDVWSSPDGVTWTEVLADDATPPATQFSQRQQLTSLVFDSKMWIIGGDDGSKLNDVWYSSNGSSWTEATSSAGFTARVRMASVTFQDKMWIITGNDGSNTGDVWSSSDGITWLQATALAGFSARQGSTAILYEDKMWLIAGNDGSQEDDVWSYGKELVSKAVITDDSMGILVGTGTTGFTSTDTALATKIAHGTGAGQLEYGVCPDTSTTTEPATVGDKTSMKIARNFINNSGASITIKEVGIQSVNGLLCRVILSTPITIINGASEIISFAFETEV